MKINSALSLFLLASIPVCLAQMPDSPTSNNLVPPSSLSASSQGTVSLQEFTRRLNSSFQAVAQARDAEGFVNNRAVLKAHTANLKAFSKALKRKELPAVDLEEARRQDVARLLHDTTEAFYAFEQVNDQPYNPEIVVTMDVHESFATHTKSLSQLTAAVQANHPNSGGTSAQESQLSAH